MARKKKRTGKRTSKGRGRRMGGGKDDLMQLGVGIAAAVAGKIVANKVIPDDYKKYSAYALLAGGVVMSRMKNPLVKAAGVGLAIMGGQSVVGTLVPSLAGATVRFNNQGRRVNGFNQVPGIGQGFPRPNAIGQGFPKPSALGNVAGMYAAGAFD